MRSCWRKNLKHVISNNEISRKPIFLGCISWKEFVPTRTLTVCLCVCACVEDGACTMYIFAKMFSETKDNRLVSTLLQRIIKEFRGGDKIHEKTPIQEIKYAKSNGKTCIICTQHIRSKFSFKKELHSLKRLESNRS